MRWGEQEVPTVPNRRKREPRTVGLYEYESLWIREHWWRARRPYSSILTPPVMRLFLATVLVVVFSSVVPGGGSGGGSDDGQGPGDRICIPYWGCF